MNKTVCTLDKDINNCDFFNVDSGTCMREKPCSFGEKSKKLGDGNGLYVREERWYEKYYKADLKK